MITEYPNDAADGAGRSSGDWPAGQKVCLLGRFLAMNQADLAEVVRTRGGIVASFPSRSTSLVVVGGDGWPCRPDGSPTPRARRVQELRRTDATVSVISEEAFFARLGLVEAKASVGRELTAADLSRVLKIPAGQVRRWARLGLVKPRRTVHRLPFYDLAQVASARRLCELVACGASLAQVRQGLEQIERWLPQRETPLSQLALLEHDGRLLVRLNGTLAEPSGQLRFNFDPPDALVAVASPGEDSQSLFEQALAAEDSQSLAEAAELYRRALLLDPADPVLHFNRGNVLFALARYDEAAGHYSRAVRLDAGFAEAWNNLGNALAQRESWHEAMSAFRRAIQLVPQYEDAQFNLDRLLRRMPLRRLSLPE